MSRRDELIQLRDDAQAAVDQYQKELDDLPEEPEVPDWASHDFGVAYAVGFRGNCLNRSPDRQSYLAGNQFQTEAEAKHEAAVRRAKATIKNWIAVNDKGDRRVTSETVIYGLRYDKSDSSFKRNTILWSSYLNPRWLYVSDWTLAEAMCNEITQETLWLAIFETPYPHKESF